MKKISFANLIIGLLCISFLNINAQQTAIFQDNTNFTKIEKDGSILLPSSKAGYESSWLTTAPPAESKDWSDFIKENGNWTVIYDKITNTPHYALGKPIKIKGYDRITNDNVEAAAMSFLKENSKVLNINPDNLSLLNANEVDRRWYVNYEQVHQGTKVLLSKVSLRIFENGNVMAFSADYFNNIDINLTPTIFVSEAKEKAYEGLEYNNKKVVTQSSGKLYILPVKFATGVKFSLVYKVDVSSSENYERYTSYVDAHSGNIVWRINKTYNAASSIESQGAIVEKFPTDEHKVKLFPNQYITIGGTRYTTNSNGKINIDINSDTQVSSKLEGPWAKVAMKDDVTASYSGTIKSGENLMLNWDETNSNLYERIMFFHANYVHDYIRNIDTSLKCMDFQLQLTINKELYMGVSPQAGSDPQTGNIEFWGAGNMEMRLAESPAVLYHEYGHSVTTRLYKSLGKDDGMTNMSVHEAFADLFSCLIQDVPAIGLGVFPDETQSIRNLRNNLIYPDSIEGEGHHDSQILSGAYWDLKEATSLDYIRHISHFIKYSLIDGANDGEVFTDWFLETITLDDDDGNLSNGTPHLTEIINSFNRHQIGTNLLMATTFSHTPLKDTKDTINPYIVEFELGGSNILGAVPDSVTLIYSTNNFVNQVIVPAIKLGTNSYKAEIPAQKNGVLVKYYVSAVDNFSKMKMKFSSKSDSFLPYEFLVGYSTALLVNFEGYNGWTVGSSQDNATTGKWECAIPQETSMQSSVGIYIFQPGANHTENGSKCFVTGAKSGTGSLGRMIQYMPDAITTLTSPKYDISGLKNPLIRYYKWFAMMAIMSGEEYLSQWIVDVSSDGGNSWVNVENNIEPGFDWEKVQFSLNDYIPTTNNFKIRFIVDVKNGGFGFPGALTEGLLDDFEIITSNDAIITSVDNGEAPMEDMLNAVVYPNPVSSNVTFSYYIPNQSEVKIGIYDMMGAQVKIIADEIQTAGTKNYTWDVLNEDGNRVGAGIYILRLQAGKDNIIKKLIIN